MIFFIKKRFSYLDIVIIQLSVTMFNHSHYMYAALVFIIGVIIAIYLEMKYEE